MNDRIFVTKPELPPLEDLSSLFEEIWNSKILTNCGPLHNRLETELADYLGVPYISLFSNGTLALIAALKASKLHGEVITTPFSFVATAQAIAWSNLQPVFADIDPLTFCLDPKSVEKAISPFTTAILPVHCYGIPCDINAFDELADNYNLKIIYDAAHSFGVQCDCGSVLTHGDFSVLSFHATKVFNTFEGGAVVSPDLKSKKRIDKFKNFGFVNEFSVASLGINAKMSEINSAIGLAQLKHIDKYIEKRKDIAELYSKRLGLLSEIALVDFSSIKKPNYSYFPILIEKTDAGLSAEGLYFFLKENNIFSRRYFYPLLPDLSIFKNTLSGQSQPLINSQKCAESVLCLPLYPSLSSDSVQSICDAIENYISFHSK